MAATPELTPKTPWKIDHAVAVDQRSWRALEFIAMYLDRIETHLDRIASSVETGNVNERLRLEVSTIAQMLPNLLRK